VQTASRPAAARPIRVPFPRRWPVRASDIVALLVANGALIVAMWIRHGGASALASPGAILTAAGQITALLGTYLALIQLVLMSRSPWLDQTFGMDRLAWAHRWLGFGTVWLLAGHVVFTTFGWSMADGRSLLDETTTLLGTYPFVLMAAASMACFAAVAITSVRAARRRLSYETWYGIHLYAYLGIALGFAHQLVVGSDFINDPVARIYWTSLLVTAVAMVLVFRFGQPIRTTLRHRPRIGSVVTEAPGVVSVYVTGRDLDRLAARSGQYFNLRLLTRNDWWRAHPFSLSAAPNGRSLRFTIKELGDWTARLQALKPGTRVALEGPYGTLTGARRTRQRVLLVAGGIGITPLRALLESLPGRPGDLTLIYRASREADLVFREELDALAAHRGAAVHYLVGRRGTRAMPRDPLDADGLRALVPDVRNRDVYLCGPTPLMESVRASLKALAVPASQVHLERFAY
jgi:predicted ferric reductase